VKTDGPWEPLHRSRAGRRHVRSLRELGRCLSAHLRDEPPPAPTDWADVVATAESYRLTPALWEAVGAADGLTVNMASRLQAQYAANVVALARMSDQLRNCLEALNRGGMQPMVLKGALAVLEGGSVLPARMMTDIDLLVSEDEFDRACAALRRIGYVVSPGPGASGRSASVARRSDLAAPIDLHRALGWGAVSRALPAAAVLGRASSRQDDGLTYRAMEPADQLAHAVVHSQSNDMAHRTGSIAVRQLYNFALLHHHLNDPNAWRRAVERLSHPEMRRVVGGHAALERYLFGLDLPVPEPTAGSRLHLARCVASYAVPYLADVETNLVLAFEAETMLERYPGSSPNAARARHVIGLLQGGLKTVRDEALKSRNR
jgi:Uncharacterised nucleotidyltransferase